MTGPGNKYRERVRVEPRLEGRRDRKEKEEKVFSGCDIGNQEERDDVCGRLHS